MMVSHLAKILKRSSTKAQERAKQRNVVKSFVDGSCGAVAEVKTTGDSLNTIRLSEMHALVTEADLESKADENLGDNSSHHMRTFT